MLAAAAVSFLLGAATFGWNGIMLSEIATRAPTGRAADATGGMQVVMFGGIVVFPVSFTALVTLTGSYAVAFGLLAALALAGAVTVLGARERACSSCSARSISRGRETRIGPSPVSGGGARPPDLSRSDYW